MSWVLKARLFPSTEPVAHFKEQVIGKHWDTHGLWPMYSKFFDNQWPLPFHIHHRDVHAALVGKMGKPEAYYFPPQLNNHDGEFPFTFFGLHPEVTKEQVLEKLALFLKGGDNKITELSKAYKISPGTGWDVPSGILHAPASICTYEPQAASDVFAMTESWSNNREVPDDLLWKDVPQDKIGSLEYILEIVDWGGECRPRLLEPPLHAARGDQPERCRRRHRVCREVDHLSLAGLQCQGTDGQAGRQRRGTRR